MSDALILFIVLVFLAFFLLVQGFVGPLYTNFLNKRLQQRLDSVSEAQQEQTTAHLLQGRYLQSLSPLGRRFGAMPSMARLSQLIQQAGRSYIAYRFFMFSVMVGVVVAILVWLISKSWSLTIAALVLSTWLPIAYIFYLRNQRLVLFEQQLPEAIDLIQRALKAGHPLVGALKLIADTMDEPISKEFDITYSEITYAGDVRKAMLSLFNRVPSLTVMMLATAVSLQRETGGNLAESLGQISTVIRSRFKFERKLKTLSAEGRLSGLVLVLMPLILFSVMWFFYPDYITKLTAHPKGPLLIQGAITLNIIGMFWIRQLIRIKA